MAFYSNTKGLCWWRVSVQIPIFRWPFPTTAVEQMKQPSIIPSSYLACTIIPEVPLLASDIHKPMVAHAHFSSLRISVQTS